MAKKLGGEVFEVMLEAVGGFFWRGRTIYPIHRMELRLPRGHLISALPK
jgi:hypothetical protein